MRELDAARPVEPGAPAPAEPGHHHRKRLVELGAPAPTEPGHHLEEQACGTRCPGTRPATERLQHRPEEPGVHTPAEPGRGVSLLPWRLLTLNLPVLEFTRSPDIFL